MNYKNSTIYQIYIKSFQDSDGDGIGDINGITMRLDYLKDLGVDYLWITPFFKSPQNDNGYDVEDYLSIDPLFGTMEDVEQLINETRKRNMGLMFDMVFNHTSTKHQWFQRALSGDKKYMDYYIFKDGSPDEPPTNWKSKFGGSAWEYVPSLKKWYLHLFDVTQADLNWENPAVREELKHVIRFWKEKGINGFRFDVVNLISKPALFENDLEGDGRRFYTDGPHVHEYLKELVADTGIQNMVTVGEMSSTSLDNCVRYTSPKEKELSMCFNFHHLKVDYLNGNKWELMSPDYQKLSSLLSDWQIGMQEHNGWNALFWCNHDQPRAVSRFGNDKNYWKDSAKMLASSIHLLRGTPYIFQGEELGMTNASYTDISQYRDVESTNYYKIMQQQGKTSKEALQILNERSRDNGRTPMQWDASAYAGFSSEQPWIEIPENHSYINAEAEEIDQSSILNYHKQLIQLRKKYDVISNGSISFLPESTPEIFAYRRFTDTEELMVWNNFSEKTLSLEHPFSTEGWKHLIGNKSVIPENVLMDLRPYETIAYYRSLL